MTTPIQLETERLRLVAGTEAIVRAEIEDRVEMARLLAAAVPGTWPPPLNDDASMRHFLRYAQEHPGETGFGCWYWLRVAARPGGLTLLVGNGGFKGPPSEEGTVEVGYSMLPGHQRQGYATEGVRALVGWAFRDPRVRRVIAETTANGTASQRVLAKNGFARTGEPPTDPGAVRYALPREAWEGRTPQ